MSNKIKFSKNDVDDFYEPSDSEEEYTEKEKTILKKVRNGRKKNYDSEEEVLAFDEDDSDFDDKTEAERFVADSDVEDEHDDYMPDAAAWGSKKRDYYNTDFVDQDYSTYTEKEEKYAEQEEQEARTIQLRLAKQLDEADFSLDVFSTPGQNEEKETSTEIHLKTDLSQLSERQKDQLFKKDSPEFEGLVQDFQQRLEESEQILEPVLDYFKSKKLEKLPIFEFVATKNKLILNYCTNVAFYLVLKSKRIPIKNHPLVKRLVQMRQLLIQLEDKYVSVVKPQLELLLEELSEGKDVVIRIPGEENKVEIKKKKLKMMKSMEVDDDDDLDLDNIKLDESSDEENKVEDDESDDNDDDKDMEEEIEGGEIEEAGEENAKRPITYQIAKNKGLKQFRKKELRNPRVKHKLKYKKALIRRKGAVRTVRKEVKRYGGEMSGIKATVKKGIKIK